MIEFLAEAIPTIACFAVVWFALVVGIPVGLQLLVYWLDGVTWRRRHDPPRRPRK